MVGSREHIVDTTAGRRGGDVLEYVRYEGNHGVLYSIVRAFGALVHTQESWIDPTFHIWFCFSVEIKLTVNFPVLPSTTLFYLWFSLH
jgi:hypothetical protein